MAQDKNQNTPKPPPKGSVISTEDHGISRHESGYGPQPGANVTVSETVAPPQRTNDNGKEKK